MIEVPEFIRITYYIDPGNLSGVGFVTQPWSRCGRHREACLPCEAANEQDVLGLFCPRGKLTKELYALRAF
jgi:hypothetical protein